ncbi:unnamed protein product [Ceratitis capitata]|uniref:(Mediterranean fruit fly) hypothetical protein n=1 Tax=Ceratitis capitata TaxID=7213 RepID=A0A811VMS4_CERCA|nr:unnamed protein product [Ceratitis capitata]
MDDKPAFVKKPVQKSFFNYAMTTKRWHRIAPVTSVANETGEDVVLFFMVIFIAITTSTVKSTDCLERRRIDDSLGYTAVQLCKHQMKSNLLRSHVSDVKIAY